MSRSCERPRHAVPPFARDWALFLDIDGTLLPIEDHPDQVQVPPAARALIQRLDRDLGGALALISGRTLADIDRLFGAGRPAAGQHGAERRDARGGVHQVQREDLHHQTIQRRLAEFVAAHPGTLLEDKGMSLALHYRRAPELADEVRRFVYTLEHSLPAGFHVVPGKMVYEFRAEDYDKGRAVLEFMNEPPFAGRVPVVVGDDVTDEDAFHVVNRLGGHSIKVGEGDSCARWRLDSPAAVLAWLEEYAAYLESARENGRE